MMRIGVIVDNDLNGDIRVLREIRILKQQGFEVYTLCFGFIGKNYADPVTGVSRIRIRRKIKDTLFFFLNLVPLYEWFWKSKIKKHIIKHDIDVLHVHDLYMAKAAFTGIKNSKKNIPLILDLHENYPYTIQTYNWTKGAVRHLLSRPGAWMRKEKKYLSFAGRIIVLSEEYRDLLISKYGFLKKENFIVLPNVPDISLAEYTNKFAVANPFSNDYPVMFYYGVIAERRGIFDALPVFADLIDEAYGINFLIIGPVDKKDQPRFNNMIKDIPSERLLYIPWIDSKQFPGYLEICDICIAPFHKNPQHESGVANKVFDYMLGGKPVIVSDCKPQADLVRKYSCGLVYSDYEGFRASLIKLLGDKSLRSEMGENGRMAIINELNMEKVKSGLLSMYNSLFPSE